MAVTETPQPDRSIAEELAVAAGILQQSTVHVRSGRMGAGSGVIWSDDGLIITNAHVARTDTPTVELWDGREFDAELVARDDGRDLAALQIRASGLPAVEAADSDALRVGQLGVALGNPLGMSGALTLGIVHAIAPAEGRGRQDWIQADVRLAPGNSGGPLADAEGRVIGINSMVSAELGLAVPSNAVGQFLRNRGERPFLGVTTQAVLVAHGGERRRPGILILEVQPESPAAAAGLIQGDVIVGSAGRPLAHPHEFLNTLVTAGPGGVLTLDLLRAGEEQHLVVALGHFAATERRAAA